MFSCEAGLCRVGALCECRLTKKAIAYGRSGHGGKCGGGRELEVV